MQRIACPERDDWRANAEQRRLRLPHHRRRALLGRARLLRLHAGRDRARHRSADRRTRRACAASWSRARSTTSACCSALRIPEAFWTLDRRKLEARRRQPLWPFRSAATTDRDRRSCSNTMPTRRPRCSRPRCFNGRGWSRRWSASIIPKRRRSVQFAPRAADRALEGDRARPPSASRRHCSTTRRTPARSTIWRTPRGRPALRPRCWRSRRSAATPKGGFVDLDDRPIALAFKLYPWEWMFRDAFGAKLAGAPTRWIEPPWKAILSNKGILPLLWEMFPRHPEPAAGLFRGRPEGRRARQFLCAQAALFARRRQRRRWSAAATPLDQQAGPYGGEGFVRQAVRAAAELRGHLSGGRKLARRPRCRAGCRSARTRARSPGTPRDFCRTRFCETRRPHRTGRERRTCVLTQGVLTINISRRRGPRP